MTTQELKDELKRRETKHNIKVGATTVALNLDEMQEVFDQIFVHLTPVPVKRSSNWPPIITETEWNGDPMGG